MNQILVSEKIYVTPDMKRKKKMYRLLYFLSVLIIIALIIFYWISESDRRNSDKSGEILGLLGDDTTMVDDRAIVVALDDATYDEGTEGEAPIVSGADDTPTESVTVEGRTYNTEAILRYPSLGINYPVLSEESDSMLKVSVCKYWGPAPNSVGNYCIVGHNYRNGNMFGKLSMADYGDTFTLSDLSGNTVTYEVYNRYVVDPTDVACTSQLTGGTREVTLITCTNFGKQRLVVKGKEV